MRSSKSHDQVIHANDPAQAASRAGFYLELDELLGGETGILFDENEPPQSEPDTPG
jgi:hypothetical protein